MVRVDFFERVGMFDPTLIAGEEPELCARIRSAGGGVYRLSENMTRHDAALFTFNAWWRRMSRCGYGAKAVVQRLSKRMPVNEVPFRDLTTSAVIWCDGWLTLLVFTALVAHASGVPKIPVGSTGGWLENALLALVVGLFVQALQCIRVAWLSRARGSPLNVLIYAVFLQIGKWPQRLGQLLWYRDNIVRKPARLIEYKT